MGRMNGVETEPRPRIAPASRAWLLETARNALGHAMGVDAGTSGPIPDDPILDEPARVFVSWHEGRRLVGCIGTLEPERGLRDAVRYFTVQAGLHDPRTPTPSAADLPRLSCEISVLSPAVPMTEFGLEAITAALIPGRDGLVLREGERSAVFLPVVWKNLPQAAEFVEALRRKARIDERRGSLVRGERFFAEDFGEHE